MPRPTTTTGPYLEFGKALRAARRRADLTQEELARRADISTAYPGHLERGLYMPSREVLHRICRVLDADYNHLAELLGWYRRDADEEADVAQFRSYPRGKRRAILDWLVSWDLRRDQPDMREEQRHGDGEEDDDARG